ncbi:uncharacterized protein HD556DRAFT_1525091 [Suillus plorans]|uniref:Uncharacterized protein n=1 Tax=Suillus plorans TaxID=116603 RepID=A0A9P7J2Y5_9AGAM|nr:uncharacterized protein HD556DRAFT_1525091 [Suillus plorans]KAG1799811.1 hypothetical protein HD556DRAFT_1525091 [Suillus plorans]
MLCPDLGQFLLVTTPEMVSGIPGSAGKRNEALEAHKNMISINKSGKASCLDWYNGNDVACSLNNMTIFLAYTFPSSPLSLLTIMQAEIPGQIQDGYDAVPNFFHEIHQHSQIVHYDENSSFGSSTCTTHYLAAFKTHLRRLFTLPPHHQMPPVVDISLTQGVPCFNLRRNAAAGAPGSDDSLIRDEDYHGPPSPDADLQQQQRPAAVQVDNGEHGRGWACC